MADTQTPAQATPEAGKEKEKQTPAPAAAPAAKKEESPAVKTSEQLLDEANAATEAWQAETDPAKKEELKKAAKDLVEKTKAQMKAEKDALKPAEKKAPEKYELALPKDSLLPKERLDKISAFAKEKGLSNEEAQVIVDRESEAVAEDRQSQKAAFVTMNNGWLEELKADKEIGGDKLDENSEQAARVIDTFGTPEFKKELMDSGMGRHPGLFRMLVKIAGSMKDDKFIPPGAQSEEKKKSLVDKFYPTTPSTQQS